MDGAEAVGRAGRYAAFISYSHTDAKAAEMAGLRMLIAAAKARTLQ